MKLYKKLSVTRFYVVMIVALIFATSTIHLSVSAQQSEAPAPQTASSLLTQRQELMAAEGAAADEFGSAIAISNDLAVIGSPTTRVDGKENAGAAYVFNRVGNDWVQKSRLVASDPASASRFGDCVAIDGDTIVIGTEASSSSKGGAYVFVRSEENWTEQQKLLGSDVLNNSRFGSSVDIDGDTIVAGAQLHDIAGTPNENKGAAYIFVRSAGVWTEQARLLGEESQPFDFFGASVSIDGNTVAIGAPDSANLGMFDPGSVYIFVRDNNQWTLQDWIMADDSAHRAGFGQSVSLSGERLLIGAGSDDGHGSAYVFARAAETWNQEAKLVADDALSSDAFGSIVSLSGDRAIIGAPGDDFDGANNQGSAYIFRRSENVWIQLQKLIADKGVAADQCGFAVASDGPNFLVGIPLFDLPGQMDQGIALFFSDQPFEVSPQIESVRIKGKNLIITGMNFQSPVEVYINGLKNKKSITDIKSPATTIIAKKAAKPIAPGQTITIQVKNRDTGATSSEFMFTRPNP